MLNTKRISVSQSALLEEMGLTEYGKYEKLNEASQSTIASSLVNILFENIKNRYHEFDTTLIAKSQGNVKKLRSYEYLIAAHNFLADLVSKENNEEMITEINILKRTLVNLEKYAREFKFGYDTENNLIVMVYETTFIGLLTATSNFLAYGLDYVKDHKIDHLDVFSTLHKRRIDEIKAYTANLNRYNVLSDSGEMDRFFKYAKKENTLNEEVAVIGITVGSIIAIFFGVLFMLRWIVYLYFRSKQNISDYMKYLAEFTRLNIKQIDPADKATIQKQESAINSLNKYSRMFEVEMARSTKETTKEIKIESKVDYKKARVDSEPEPEIDEDNDTFL